MYGDPYAYYSNGIVNPAYGYGTPTYGNNVPVGYVPTIATVTTKSRRNLILGILAGLLVLGAILGVSLGLIPVYIGSGSSATTTTTKTTTSTTTRTTTTTLAAKNAAKLFGVDIFN